MGRNLYSAHVVADIDRLGVEDDTPVHVGFVHTQEYHVARFVHEDSRILVGQLDFRFVFLL